MKEIWIASVIIKSPGRDSGYVYQTDEADLTVTNRLAHIPPVQDNVSYYRGSFPSKAAALAAIADAFPQASVRT